MNYGEGLPKKLRIMAGMLNMGERIQFGSDAELMYLAADKIDEAKELLRKAAYSIGDRAVPDTADYSLFQEITRFLERDDDE